MKVQQKRFNPINPQQETLLWEAGTQQARAELIERNMRYVSHIAQKFIGQGLPYEDLVAAGYCGLIKAVDKFDPNKKTRLLTFAHFYIVQSIEYAIHQQHLIWTPVNQMLALRQQKEQKSSGHARQAMQAAASLSQPNEDGHQLEDRINSYAPNPHQVLESLEQKDWLYQLLNKLDSIDAQIVSYWYGLNVPQLEPEEIAQQLNITVDSVKKYHYYALQKLKKFAKKLKAKS
jgi:RNA polymerase sigma factor (sigma-70 family)